MRMPQKGYNVFPMDYTNCKLKGESHSIEEIATDCPFKREASKPIYNWVASDPVKKLEVHILNL